MISLDYLNWWFTRQARADNVYYGRDEIFKWPT